MSSTERAPEPTMEEILASIRRIITDDEAGQGKATKPAQRAQSEDESLEGEADNQIIDDIARVLSGGAAPANEEEEILDLTAELGGLEIVEDDEPVFEIDEEVAEILELEEIVEEAPEQEAFGHSAGMTDEAPAPDEVLAPEEVPQQSEPDQRELAGEPEMAMPAPPPQPPQPEPQPEAPKLSASEEAASALERAIAALRAGQVPTSTTPQAEPFQFQAAPQPEAMTAPEYAEPEPLPMPEPEPVAETHPETEAYFEPQSEASVEAEPEEGELVLAEVEETIEFSEPALEPEPEFESEREAPPFWRAEAVAEQPSAPEPVHDEPEPESVAAQMNGGAHHDVAGKTLEEQVKDMLRPMLRQWLDENMPRIVREMDPDALRRNLD